MGALSSSVVEVAYSSSLVGTALASDRCGPVAPPHLTLDLVQPDQFIRHESVEHGHLVSLSSHSPYFFCVNSISVRNISVKSSET